MGGLLWSYFHKGRDEFKSANSIEFFRQWIYPFFFNLNAEIWGHCYKTLQLLLSGRLLDYPQTLDKAGRLVRNKRYSILQVFLTYGRKKLYIIGPAIKCFGAFLSSTLMLCQDKLECLSLVNFSGYLNIWKVRPKAYS